MNYLSQYTIPFYGLVEGKHLFDFTADERFFCRIRRERNKEGKRRCKG